MGDRLTPDDLAAIRERVSASKNRWCREDVLLAEVERVTAERDAARAEVAALEGRIRGLADGVDPDWRREHEGLVTPADLRALLATPTDGQVRG